MYHRHHVSDCKHITFQLKYTCTTDNVISLSSDGIITREDLLAYHASFKQTVNVTIQNGRYVLYNPPPPTSGAVIDFIINILDGKP